MSNSIPKIEFSNINSFGQVTTKKYPSEYWMQPADNRSAGSKDRNIKEKKEPLKPAILINPEAAVKSGNTRALGIYIASATILTAAGIFFLLRGGPKGLPKQFQKLRNFFDKRVQSNKLESRGEISLIGRSNIAIVKGIDNILKKAEAVNNFTTFRDLLFKKFMFNSITGKYTGKIHDAITRMFEKLGRQSVVNTYKKTSTAIDATEKLTAVISRNVMRGSTFDLVEINGVTRTKAQWILEANRLNREITETYHRYFSAFPLRSRYYRVKKAAEELKSEFSNLRIFFSKDLFTEFMAESAMIGEKTAVQNLVKGHRRKISYSLRDLGKDSENQIMKMTEVISFKDASRISALRTLRSNIAAYVKNPANMQLKNKIVTDVDLFANEISTAVKNKTLDKNIADNLLTRISILKDNFINFKQGKVEDILDIYKKILPESEYKIVEKSYSRGVKSLDKSIRIETEEFVSKLRDLALGGAPTDILTIIGPLGVLGYYLGKSEDNEQRTSISLKYGIPALAGIGVTMYCNAKLYAGTKSLIIGTLSTIVLNKIGVWAEHLLKKSRQNSSKQADTNNVQSGAAGVKDKSISQKTELKNPPKTV